MTWTNRRLGYHSSSYFEVYQRRSNIQQNIHAKETQLIKNTKYLDRSFESVNKLAIIEIEKLNFIEK